MHCRAATGELFSRREPAEGNVVMQTAIIELDGLSLPSVKPKSDVRSVYGVSSNVVAALFAPLGGSLTGSTLIVSVFATGSRSTPGTPNTTAVPPLSCTRKVKVA